MRPSPSGGAWIVSFGTIVRVLDRPGTRDGFKVVERPSAWHGLMASDAADVLEEADGNLWIATLAGVVQIPADVRRESPAPPPVELVDVLQDGERLPWREGVKLPWRRNRIELRFAALSFRDPSLLRVQVRLRRGGAWREASGPPFHNKETRLVTTDAAGSFTDSFVPPRKGRGLGRVHVQAFWPGDATHAPAHSRQCPL